MYRFKLLHNLLIIIDTVLKVANLTSTGDILRPLLLVYHQRLPSKLKQVDRSFHCHTVLNDIDILCVSFEWLMATE